MRKVYVWMTLALAISGVTAYGVAHSENLLALIYARRGDDQQAVQHYLDACRQERSYVSRGNLDPEIATLIRKYGLNKPL